MIYVVPDDGGFVRWGRQPFGVSGATPPVDATGFETRHRFANESHPFVIWYSRGSSDAPPPSGETGFETRHRFANENHDFIIWYSRGVSGVIPPTPTPTVETIPAGGGVKRRRPKVIRLNDIANREETADFIKSFLKTETGAIVEPVVGEIAKRDSKADEVADLAMQNMEIERQNESRIEYNNSLILLMLMSL